jgi:hypothetical protein
MLEQRLKAEQAFKENPAILETSIKKPLVITGMVRTGSTALQYLAGQDNTRQHMNYWLSERPQPRPPREQWADHPDFKATQARIDGLYERAPEQKSMHFAAADYPEECGHLLAQTFTDEYWQICSKVSHYNKWYEHCDMVPSYQQHKKLLQLIASSCPDVPWTLKYPVHLKHLKSFLKVYPDAQIIWTHRDPAQVMQSYANMNATSRLLSVRPETLDRDDLHLEQVEVWADATERALEIRAQYPQAQFYDIHFNDYMADPVGSLLGAYKYFGIECSDETEQAFHAWNNDNPQHKHGKHKHGQAPTLKMSREAVRERFAPYIKASGVAVAD